MYSKAGSALISAILLCASILCAGQTIKPCNTARPYELCFSGVRPQRGTEAVGAITVSTVETRRPHLSCDPGWELVGDLCYESHDAAAKCVSEPAGDGCNTCARCGDAVMSCTLAYCERPPYNVAPPDMPAVAPHEWLSEVLDAQYRDTAKVFADCLECTGFAPTKSKIRFIEMIINEREVEFDICLAHGEIRVLRDTKEKP